MTRLAENIAEQYRSAGFFVSQTPKESSLMQIANNPLITCSDGRRIAGTVYAFQELGIKVLGATPGQANLLAAKEAGFFKKTTLKHLGQAIELNAQNGHVSGFHDIHDHEVHCGQQGLMQSKKVATLPVQAYSPQEAKSKILTSWGQGLELLGKHQETRIIVNMVENTSRIADGSAFMLDVWYMLKIMKIPSHIIVASSAEIIKKLSSVRNLVVVG